jgi:hypothetical protein
MKLKIAFAAFNLAIVATVASSDVGQEDLPAPAPPFKGQIGLSAKD